MENKPIKLNASKVQFMRINTKDKMPILLIHGDGQVYNLKDLLKAGPIMIIPKES